jgi:hypothetical protein
MILPSYSIQMTNKIKLKNIAVKDIKFSLINYNII